MRRPGIKPGSRPWQGRILSLYYRRRRAELSIPRLELGTSRVLGERHDQLDHTDLSVSGVSGFRSQYLDLAKVARFRLRQYPMAGRRADGWKLLRHAFAKRMHAGRALASLKLASIAQLAEHALSKRKVASSILAGGSSLPSVMV